MTKDISKEYRDDWMTEIMCKWLDVKPEMEYDDDGNPDGWTMGETFCRFTKECFPDCPCEKYEPCD